MRKVMLALPLVAGLGVVAQAASAQTRPIRFGVQLDLATNSVGPGVGARVAYTGLGTVLKVPGLQAYGAFDYFFPASSFGVTPKIWEFNANATWDIPNVRGFAPYVGAGLDYAHYSAAPTIAGASGTASWSYAGLNLLGGARFNLTPKLNGFGEIRAEIRTGSAIVFTAGVLY